MIDTPVTGYIDKVSDARWIYQNYIDKSADLLKDPGLSIDASADLGTLLSINIIKKITITGLYANGYGYKNTVMENREHEGGTDQYKNYGYAWQGMLVAMPLKGLSAFGYYRYQDTNTHNKNNYISYYGGGITYSVKLVKAGFTYSFPEKSVNDSTTTVKTKYSIFDAWVNVNLDPVIDQPVLLYGRFAMGKAENNEAKAALGTVYGENTIIYGIGAGYTINDNIRLMCYYNNTKYKEADKADSDIFIKSEIKF